MKSSVETKVVAAITASFIALTVGAMLQENSGNDTRRRAENNRVDVGELTKDGSLRDLATAETIGVADHARRK